MTSMNQEYRKIIRRPPTVLSLLLDNIDDNRKLERKTIENEGTNSTLFLNDPSLKSNPEVEAGSIPLATYHGATIFIVKSTWREKNQVETTPII